MDFIFKIRKKCYKNKFNRPSKFQFLYSSTEKKFPSKIFPPNTNFINERMNLQLSNDIDFSCVWEESGFHSGDVIQIVPPRPSYSISNETPVILITNFKKDVTISGLKSLLCLDESIGTDNFIFVDIFGFRGYERGVFIELMSQNDVENIIKFSKGDKSPKEAFDSLVVKKPSKLDMRRYLSIKNKLKVVCLENFPFHITKADLRIHFNLIPISHLILIINSFYYH